MIKEKKYYSKEFKEEAIKLVLRRIKPLKNFTLLFQSRCHFFESIFENIHWISWLN